MLCRLIIVYFGSFVALVTVDTHTDVLREPLILPSDDGRMTVACDKVCPDNGQSLLCCMLAKQSERHRSSIARPLRLVKLSALCCTCIYRRTGDGSFKCAQILCNDPIVDGAQPTTSTMRY